MYMHSEVEMSEMKYNRDIQTDRQTKAKVIWGDRRHRCEPVVCLLGTT